MMAPLLGRWELLLVLWWLVERTLFPCWHWRIRLVFHHQFSGNEQNDSHEFLMYLLACTKTWGEVVCLPVLMMVLHLITWQQKGRTANPLIITILFQVVHKHVISCGNCQHESLVWAFHCLVPCTSCKWKQHAMETPSLLINAHSAARKEKL